MIRPLFFVFTLHFGRAGDPAAARDPWLSADKAKHLLTSMVVESVSFSALRATHQSKKGSLIGATALTASIGVGKELYDRKFGGDPSFKDLAADGAGIVAAAVVLHQTER